MKVLVTGGAGFIGLHVVEQLLEENYEVVVIDHLPEPRNNKLPKKLKIYKEKIESKRIEGIFKKERPDCLIHLAAQISVHRSMENPYGDCLSNVLGTVNILKNCVNYNVKKLVFASSAAVYGEPSYIPIDELHPKQSISYYSLSKNIGEEYIKLFHKQFNLDYTILRFSNVYGPGQNPAGEAGVISIFIDQILRGISPTIFGGNQVRDFIYVKDVANAIIAAIKFSESGIFNVSSNTETSIKELITALIEIIKSEVTPKYAAVREGEILVSRLDNQKAIKELNWNLNYSLEEGLRHTVESLINSKEPNPPIFFSN